MCCRPVFLVLAGPALGGGGGAAGLTGTVRKAGQGPVTRRERRAAAAPGTAVDERVALLARPDGGRRRSAERPLKGRRVARQAGAGVSVSGTPRQTGTNRMRYWVQDEDGDTDSQSFTITVQDTSPVLLPIRRQDLLARCRS